MSLRPLRFWPDPVLRERCAEVGEADVSALVTDMFETMYDAKGRGLAAPQVGAALRVFVMDAGWKAGDMTPRVCIDPVILSASDEMATGPEGCLSIPGITADVTRPARITLGWTDLSGARQEADLEGFEAICAQHEIDHLNGVVTFDRVDATTRARLLAEYAA